MSDGKVRYRTRDAESADEAWLDGLRRRAYADLFAATWGGWDEARHSRHFADSMKRGNISIIEVEGTRVGMIQLLEHGDTVEIREIQIEPRHQARGIGTSVLVDVIAKASAQGREVRLSVGVKNEEAIRLYERLGFVTVGQSETHRHMRYGRPDRP
ncbi:MAG TPA: GNAT family N-acetyltransferase [Longimicrobiales bacterium]|nr:GNAT family N-acetyltransferase [Longimicrobiales bacterium]